MIPLWPALLFSGLLIESAAPELRAGTLVSVAIAGKGTDGSGAQQNFTCTFTYDESLRVSGTPGKFVFTRSALTHTISYKIGNNPTVSGTGTNCEPFVITTSGNGGTTLQLTATAPSNTTVVIILQMGSQLSQAHLPFADAFPNPPLAGSTFSLSGGTTFSGTVQQLIPSELEAEDLVTAFLRFMADRIKGDPPGSEPRSSPDADRGPEARRP
jgi:hypothetical protein